ncbi:methyltransferase domain-containing protein [Bacillus infantis]|uniref:Methyltransferase domain-containing protein n=1 Tax=Bacillus infantis TaxID=324767 RepID=A0A5D4S0F7_9BACI|nr:class I SAM-dependent methyltransferase [Bacillus infantis]TYS55524.1 methyltransferase domain-containing protein [Bacillus infantis]
MKLERILPYARTILEKAVSPGDIVVDATLGNGHDALYLANLVGPNGRVYGFDIQEQAIHNSRIRLSGHGMEERATLFHSGHEQLLECIPPVHHKKIAAAIFNLGYLPGSDKTLVTRPRTTISAIEQLLEVMPAEAVIVLVIYHGHFEGAVERDYLLRYVKTIEQERAHVLQYQFINQANKPPFIIAIEKR